MTTPCLALPPRPLPPVDYDCCGGGCADCDLRRYQRALAAWLVQAEKHVLAEPCQASAPPPVP